MAQASFHLDGYDILEEIGHGGMASVWKARQRSLNRIVAIKALNPSLTLDAEALARFHHEAEASAKLHHGGIVQVYDAGEVPGIPYFVMEYVEGYSIGDLLERKGRLEEGDALAVAEGVAVALGYAWDNAKLVHCDIKPDNILLDKDGTIKVADLGVARIFGHATQNPASELIIGTPNYTSPEQANGEADLDVRSDIYSLGATLYHLVTGRLPFAGSPGSQAMDKHVSDYLDDPKSIVPGLSNATARLIEILMVKDRSKRRSSWTDVLADIRAAHAGSMPNAPAPEPGDSTVRRIPGAPSSPRVEKRVISKTSRVFKLKDALPSGAPAPTAVPAPSLKLDTGRAVRVLIMLAAITSVAYGILFFGIKPSPQAIAYQQQSAAGTDDALPYIRKAAASEWPSPSSSDVTTDGGAWQEDVFNDRGAASASKPIQWDDPDFLSGVKAFNEGLSLYTAFQKTKRNMESLAEVEAKAVEAAQFFELARPRATKEIPIDELIGNARRLQSDARMSRQLNTR